MLKVIALVPADVARTRLGLASLLGQEVGGRGVLQRTLERLGRVKSLEELVVLHPAGQEPLRLVDAESIKKPVRGYADAGGLIDRYWGMRTAARKWSLSAWRGGLGGAMCYDELLPAGPMLAAMEARGADAALIVGGDWLLVEPGYCEELVARHLGHPEAMPMTFTQAAPGLAGIVVGRRLMRRLAEGQGTFGRMLSYNPSKPQGDPIGRDVCVQVPLAVRSCVRRFIYDTPATAEMIDAVAEKLGGRFAEASAEEVVRAVEGMSETGGGFARLPRMVTLELTPRRLVTGPITPQHYVDLSRGEMALDLAERIVGQLGERGDVALTIGGLGDALLHAGWERVVEAAHAAGVLGIAIETDLLVEQRVLERLLEAPIDVVNIRMNANTAGVYERVMGLGDGQGFGGVMGRLQWLLNERNRRARDGLADGKGRVVHAGVPWLVPRLIKTAETMGDLEGFFDRWVHFLGHAVIEGSSSGCGLMPELSPVRMAPPGRFACRQLADRMTILSDGRVARCDQDWLGRGVAGDTKVSRLSEIWEGMSGLREAHAEKRWGELGLCDGCHEWHRP
jgi:hypothetical protein